MSLQIILVLVFLCGGGGQDNIVERCERERRGRKEEERGGKRMKEDRMEKGRKGEGKQNVGNVGCGSIGTRQPSWQRDRITLRYTARDSLASPKTHLTPSRLHLLS